VRLGFSGRLLAAQGILLVVLTSADGTPAWQLLRAVVLLAVAGGALATIRAGSTWLRITVVGIAGVVGCVVGGGIGIPFLVKDSESWQVFVGLGVLLCGGLLVVQAAVLFMKTRRGWRKSLVVVYGIVVVTALWTLVPSIAATNVPPTALGNFSPAHNGLSYTDVSVLTDDGVALSGWYIASHNRAAVVMLHGSGSTRSATLGQATVLARHGYGVLMLDARGHGNSGGRAMDFGWYGDHDVAAGVTFLTQQADVDRSRIGAVGLSMGGEEAIGAAANDSRIQAVVAEGATTRTAADKAGWLPNDVTGAVQRVLDTVTYGVADLLTAASPPRTLRSAVIAAAPRPILLITAGKVADEGRAAKQLAAGTDNVRIWTVADAQHTAGLATQPQEWTSTVTAFLDDALL
jgi:uncharacterized protein